MEFTRKLGDSDKNDWLTAGGKAANLGSLFRAGFAVPPGFIILTSAYQQLVSLHGIGIKIQQLLQECSSEDVAGYDQCSQAIKALFTQRPLPETIAKAIQEAYCELDSRAVAVRSSATTEDLPTASFAGIYESYLNVQTLADLLANVRACWSSLWGARAIQYRARFGIDFQKVSMAVIVQKMITPHVSGVLFTANPVNGVQTEAVINAVPGIGEPLVSGLITPDSILVNKSNGQIIRQNDDRSANSVDSDRCTPARKFVLTPKQVAELVKLGNQIEKHFEKPQDIEWAIQNDNLYIIQARPITTLSTITKSESSEIPIPPGDDSWGREGDQSPQSFDLWTRTNVGENFPYPLTPLTGTHLQVIFGLNNESAQPGQPQGMRRLYGRLYFNEGAVIHSFTEEWGLPASWLHKMWGSRPRGTVIYRNSFRPLRLLGKVLSFISSRFKRTKKTKVPHHSPGQFFSNIDLWVDSASEVDLSQLDDLSLWNSGIPAWSARGAYAWANNLRFAISAAISYGLLERLVRWWTGKNLAQDLVTGLSGIYSAEVGPALWVMARLAKESNIQDTLLTNDPVSALKLLQTQAAAQPFIHKLDEFLVRHGHRCPNELEMYNPRWAEAPEQIIELVTSYLRARDNIDPIAAETRQIERRKTAEYTVNMKLDPFRRTILRVFLKRAQRAVVIRDNSRYYMAKFLFPLRRVYAEFGKRWAAAGRLNKADDVFFLTLSEIEHLVKPSTSEVISADLQTLVKNRRLAYEFWMTVKVPEAVGADGLTLKEEEKYLKILQATPASSGTVRGRARVVQTIGEAMRLKPGEILVTAATDPGWTPVFPLVSGIVLEIGGQLSHGAIIAREYGIPAVVNIPGVMRLIQDGQMIEVDGSQGIVKLF